MSASMDEIQDTLFGEFPRAVGSPEQHLVHSREEFDLFLDTVNGRRNVYSSLAWFPSGSVVCDKVSFDFDSADKDAAFEDGLRDDEKIWRMRNDPDLAEEVLGQVCDEVQSLAWACIEEGIPTIGVFSGFGVHVHQFYEPEVNPAEKMGTTARYWREELDLTTLDNAPIGDDQRIMRVPNCRRVHVEYEEDHPNLRTVIDRWPCELWTVPLTAEEMAEASPQRLLRKAKAPRTIPVEIGERAEMPLYEDYTRSTQNAVTMRPDGPSFEGEISDEEVGGLIKELIPMPCVYENLLLDPEPPHRIRLNAAVMLFNVGLQPPDVLKLFEAIGWRDWDREVTAKHLRHIYKSGYSDMNCTTLMNEGYCTRSDEPSDCPTYNWSGGECEW